MLNKDKILSRIFYILDSVKKEDDNDFREGLAFGQILAYSSVLDIDVPCFYTIEEYSKWYNDNFKRRC